MRKHPLALPGIYRITRKSDGKVYVGQARKVSQRLASHRNQLDRGKHRNGPLQEAWNQDGPDGFIWELVAEPIGGHDPETMTFLEREVMLAHPERFNLMEPIQAYLGASESTRERLSGINKARWDDPAYKERMSLVHKERFKNPDVLAARTTLMREVHGRPEVRAKKSASQLLAWDDDRRAARGAKTVAHWQDPEHRAKQHASRAAVWEDPEVRQKRTVGMSAAWETLTPDERAARSDAAAAKQRTPEGRAAKSAQMKAIWAERKRLKRTRSTIEVIW